MNHKSMARKFSLQKRLGLGLTIGIAVLWLVAVTASGVILQKELDKVFDGALEETARRILPLAVVEIINRDNPGASHRIASLVVHEEHLSYLVRDQHGTILLRSRDADMSVFGERPHKGFITTATHRIYGAAAVRDTIYLEISEPLENRRVIALKASSALLLPLAVLERLTKWKWERVL
jgi:two-component system OmpR family sensor kinase